MRISYLCKPSTSAGYLFTCTVEMFWIRLLPLVLFILLVKCKIKHSGVFMECSRGQCGQVSDREAGWEFDQPEPFYVEEEEGGAIRKQLEEGEGRMNIV